ncbi:MAG: peptidase family protein [Actinomycetia bacterium]|nr:peptidase family protein [Actinomycetes bacterium]
MTAARIARLRESLDEPLLVTGAKNVAYLTGFESSNAAVLVEPERVRLFADARYSEAGRGVDGVEFVETGRILLADLATRLEGAIAFEEEHISHAGYRTLAAGRLELVPRRGTVEALRALKDEVELARIAAASAIADAALSALLEESWIGRTERELAARLQVLLLDGGGDGAAFDVIVGSGPNAAKPHARPGDRIVSSGELVIVDFGCLLDGYRSDCARTVAVGEPTGELAAIFEVCLEAHEAAVAGVRPGMSGVEADRIARDVIAQAGYGDRFGHGLGHGIGLDVHEAPFLSPAFDGTMEAGQVVTIEPGIYVPDVGGVRIEDLCVVRAEGLESVTRLPKRIVLDASVR